MVWPMARCGSIAGIDRLEQLLAAHRGADAAAYIDLQHALSAIALEAGAGRGLHIRHGARLEPGEQVIPHAVLAVAEGKHRIEFAVQLDRQVAALLIVERAVAGLDQQGLDVLHEVADAGQHRLLLR